MKQIKKKYIFSNFENAYFSEKLETKNLIANEFFNINLDGKSIKPTNSFIDYFYKKINDLSKYNAFFNQYEETLQKIYYLFDYEFFDEINSSLNKRYFFLDENLNLFEIDFEDLIIKNLEFKFGDFPKIVRQDSFLYLYLKTGCLIIDGVNEPAYYSDVFIPKDFEIIEENLFFINEEYPFDLFITEKTELVNLSKEWGIYETVRFDINDGKILKIIKMKEKIFVFQQYKISVYDKYNTKINIENYSYLNSKIIENTICAYDDFVIFLTTDGIKVFDGSDVADLFKTLNEKINYAYDKLFAFVFNGKYYINSKFEIDGKTRSLLIECKIDENKVLFYDPNIDIERFNILRNTDEYEFLIFGNDLNKNHALVLSDYLFSDNKYLKFNKITFDSCFEKQIDKILVFSKGKCFLKIKSDIEEKLFKVDGDFTVFNSMVKGSFFEILIYGDEIFSIDSIMMEVICIEE